MLSAADAHPAGWADEDADVICDRCSTTFDVPHNRPDWRMCMPCTLTPVHGRRSRFGTAPAYTPTPATVNEVTFIVPGPPLSQNRVHGLGFNRQGRRVMYYTKEGQAFKASIRRHAEAAIRNVHWDTTRKYELSILCYFDNPRADSDNPLKVVKDSLQRIRVNGRAIPGTEILYDDDNQVVADHDEKRMDREAPRMVVTVRAV